ncbi:MAG TPA: hypothetical protein VIL74_24050 [Pyrinomonadaceae bacterium]|jgi:hypothetical protein
MKKGIFVCLFTLTLAAFAYANFAVLEIKERVKQNNLIVVASLRDVSESETETERISKGTLTIEKIVFGEFKKNDGQPLSFNDKVRVEWRNSKMIACQFGFSEGGEQVWFLKVDERGNIEPLTPSTTASIADTAEIDAYLRKKDKTGRVESIDTINENERVFQVKPPEKSFEKPLTSMSAPKHRRKTFYPFPAVLVVVSSASLYYLLYRSRFKIR